jgi:phosphoribosylformylglycinamidine cyclo-ligase
MLRTFNCGVGMVVVADAKRAEAVIARLTAGGETVARLGEIVRTAKDEASVVFHGHLGA